MPEGASLPERMQQAGPRLTPRQRQAAEWIARTFPQVAFLTAAQVAREAGVSEATVIRLAVALGYAGYPELQAAAREGLGRTLRTFSRQAADAQGPGGVLHRVLEQEAANIRGLRNHITEADFERAVNLLCEAEAIHVVGARSSRFLAQYLGFILRAMLGPMVHILDGGVGDAAPHVAGMGPGHVAVVFTFPRYTRTTVDIARAARRRGAAVVGITDSPLSPLVPHSTVAFTCPIDSGFTWDSYAAAFGLAGALLGAVSLGLRERVVRTLGRLEEALKDLDPFLGP
ncbi:MurR/RpiR family transcriptional regulator [Caldinitratiruptor microaerophilus]|uniref:RpiR family transcriptional regulator n=1 Tax=Caldinitratiruptor microaerophilus TaxID=671077 RepID=A0AA35CLK0_9FIRM|nr:MurR/RpiR family transcriptional regulator [Caldinitratiruptor microaerophilus]BDG59531.1 RpiR family transcriptional regulator [Caldinitratiruptor microaerophilus]